MLHKQLNSARISVLANIKWCKHFFGVWLTYSWDLQTWLQRSQFMIICFHQFFKSMQLNCDPIKQSNQSTNQPTNQPINQSINQSINQPINCAWHNHDCTYLAKLLCFKRINAWFVVCLSCMSFIIECKIKKSQIHPSIKKNHHQSIHQICQSINQPINCIVHINGVLD